MIEDLKTWTLAKFVSILLEYEDSIKPHILMRKEQDNPGAPPTVPLCSRNLASLPF